MASEERVKWPVRRGLNSSDLVVDSVEEPRDRDEDGWFESLNITDQFLHVSSEEPNPRTHHEYVQLQ